jgi:hypothetical protein
VQQPGEEVGCCNRLRCVQYRRQIDANILYRASMA